MDAASQTAERQRLQPDPAGARETRKEEPFTAEDGGLDAAHGLDVVVHRGGKGYQAPGVHPQVLSGGQFLLDDGSAGVQKGEPVALERLHDEALPAEERRPDLPLERDPDRDSLGSAEKGVLLGDQPAAQLVQLDRQDLARVGRGERHMLLPAPLVHELRHEEALTGQQPFAGAEHLVHEAALVAVAEDRLHFDPGAHEHHGPRFGHGPFARIEFHLHELHFLADDPVVHLVHPAGRRGTGRSRTGADADLQFGHSGDGLPRTLPERAHQRGCGPAAAPKGLEDIGGREGAERPTSFGYVPLTG